MTYQAGGIPIPGSLTGDETVVVGNGGPQITTATTQQIADLAAHNLTTLTVGTLTVTGTATLSTTQVGLLTATQIGNATTLTVNGTTQVTGQVSTITSTSVFMWGMNTPGGTVGAVPAVQSQDPATGKFIVKATAGDTSTYNVAVMG